jgi:hypothetical protein
VEALRGAESEEVRPELVDAVMARVRAEVQEAQEAEQPEIPILRQPQPIRAFPRFRRLAAAAALFLFGTKLSAAITVTTFVAVTTATVTMVFSRDISYGRLVDILRDNASTEGQLSAALSDVAVRVRSAIETLQDFRDNATTAEAVSASIRQVLLDLQDHRPMPQPAHWMEPHDSAEAVIRARSEDEQLSYARNTASLAAAGIEAIEAVNLGRFPALEPARESYAGKLRRLLMR